MNERGNESDEKRKQDYLQNRLRHKWTTGCRKQEIERSQKLFDRPVRQARHPTTTQQSERLDVFVKSNKSDAVKFISESGAYSVYAFNNGLTRQELDSQSKQLLALLKQAQTGNKPVRVVVLEMGWVE